MKIAKFLKQTAVYWGAPIPDGYGGYTYASPVEIKVRWSDKQEKFINQNMEEVLSKSVVMLDQDVVIGGQLALTDLVSLSSSQTPEDNDAYEIKAFSKTPDIRATKFVRKIWL